MHSKTVPFTVFKLSEFNVKELVVVHREKCDDNINCSFVTRCGHWMLIATFRLLTASLLQAMGSTDSGSPLCSQVNSLSIRTYRRVIIFIFRGYFIVIYTWIERRDYLAIIRDANVVK